MDQPKSGCWPIEFRPQGPELGEVDLEQAEIAVRDKLDDSLRQGNLILGLCVGRTRITSAHACEAFSKHAYEAGKSSSQHFNVNRRATGHSRTHQTWLSISCACVTMDLRKPVLIGITKDGAPAILCVLAPVNNSEFWA